LFALIVAKRLGLIKIEFYLVLWPNMGIDFTACMSSSINEEMFMPGHPLFDIMGFEAVKVEAGIAQAKVPFNEELADNLGSLHRGVLVTLADTACGMATFSSLDEFLPIATVDLRIDYAAPIPPRCGLEAHIECHHVGKGAAHTNGVVRAITANRKADIIVARIAGIFAINTPGQPVMNLKNVGVG